MAPFGEPEMQREFNEKFQAHEQGLAPSVLSTEKLPRSDVGILHAAATPDDAENEIGNNWTAAPDEISRTPSSRGFNALLAAYQETGGTACGEDLADLLTDRKRGDLASLARKIVSGEVFSFEWRHCFWVPMFQFELHDLSLKKGPSKVLAELVKVFDPWTTAAWFAEPNSWLKRQRPVDLLDCNLAAVFEAARADRFVANG